MPLLERFLDPSSVSLKICGVTLPGDAELLTGLGVEALGVNFWPSSKRYLEPQRAGWLTDLEGSILRVGVFVNETGDLPLRLMEDGWIDVIQLHGDESLHDVTPLRQMGLPFFKAWGVGNGAVLEQVCAYGASAVLLDTHAPGVYGGTGEAFDWEVASRFRQQHPDQPVILAGGIAAHNAARAAATVRPVALDVASGAESAPGIKDFSKVRELLAAVRDVH